MERLEIEGGLGVLAKSVKKEVDRYLMQVQGMITCQVFLELTVSPLVATSMLVFFALLRAAISSVQGQVQALLWRRLHLKTLTIHYGR